MSRSSGKSVYFKLGTGARAGDTVNFVQGRSLPLPSASAWLAQASNPATDSDTRRYIVTLPKKETASARRPDSDCVISHRPANDVAGFSQAAGAAHHPGRNAACRPADD